MNTPENESQKSHDWNAQSAEEIAGVPGADTNAAFNSDVSDSDVSDSDLSDSEALAPEASDLNSTSVEALKSQLADAEKRVLLAQADLENFRRRTRRDVQDQIRYAPLGLMGEILESVDNLNRAIEAYQNDPNGDGLVEGVKLVAQQISTALQNHGCKRIDAVGQTFDPTKHQAVQMQSSDQYDANVVTADLRPGFQLHERVIRPSQVFISTGPEG